MDCLKEHKRILIVGISSFCIGYILGEITQARSFEQEFAKNIFNQVTSSHGKLGSK